MHCDHCVRRYGRESVAVEAVCVISVNYGHYDTATRNCATEWSLRVTATQLLQKRRHGTIFSCFNRTKTHQITIKNGHHLDYRSEQLNSDLKVSGKSSRDAA